VNVYPSTIVYFPWNLSVGDWSAIGEDALLYNLGPLTIGEKVTISHRAHLCGGTHDYSQPDMPLLKLPIVVQNQAWICADAFVGPGVTVGEGAVVGARAVVTKNVESWTVVTGNPARAIKKRVLSAQANDEADTKAVKN
jgi:putative colanic acid biosynthesis acetyltransferase WcaF